MKTGDQYKGYTVEKVTPLKEINLSIIELVHNTSGAKIVSVEADDEENLFALAFKTYPKDSTGIAHILEHTTLCGSEKYPLQDPFFSMIRRSSNTFMNAFTAKLWTGYPAASKIEKDYFNLLGVYLDAVFHPKLTYESFLQEGHRLEFATPDDPSSPLEIKGIVYNEMKGVFSNPSSYFWRQLMGGLCPNHIYGFDSGGDPEEIPNLTHKDLVKFHNEYYHPSRCIFFFYGNIDLKKNLDFIAKEILDHAKKLPPINPVEKQVRFTKPKRILSSYPTHETDLTKKTIIGFSWLTMDIKDQDDLLALALIDSILMDTDASLLKHKLINSGLCINAESSYDPDAREIPYAITCKGCEKENADLLEKLLFDTLEEIIKNKIPQNLIESSMHQLEFSRSEISSDYQPYALEVFGRTVLSYMQGGPLLEGVKIHSLFEKLAKLVIDENYLPSIIQKYLIDNNHMFRLVMAPDPKMLEEMQKKEKDKLASIKAKLSKAEVDAIIKQAEDLNEYQESKELESVDCLPILSLEDIPKEVSYYPIEKESVDGLAVYRHTTFTNQITYADLLFDLPQIAEEDLSYLRLFASVLTELGSGSRNYIDNLHYIHNNVGGIWTSLSLNVQRTNTQTCYPTISLCAKSLNRKNPQMFNLLRDFILTPNLKDKERIKELISQSHANLQHRINSSAIGYALKESAAGFSPWNYVNHIWHGLPYFKFLETLMRDIDKALPKIVEKFEELSRVIFHLNNPHLIITSDEETYESLASNGFYGLSRCSESSGSFQPWVELAAPKQVPSCIRFLATPIAHNAHSIPTINMTSPQAPALKLATYLFENLEIHKRVREQGGAYSSGVRFNVLTGNYQFFSSRDPKIFSTYNAFQIAVDRISEGLFSDEDLHEAILSYIQDVDGPVPPGSRASVTYFQHKVGLSLEVRQDFRNRILSTTKEDIALAVRECLLPKMANQGVRISYANEELYKNELSLFQNSPIPELAITPL